MKRFGPHAVMALVLVGLCAACNFIISANLGDYQVGNPNLSSAPCSLPPEEGGTTSCGDCIQKNCAEELAYSCDKNSGEEKTWFDDLQQCARQPYQREGVWGCSKMADLSDAAAKADPASTDDLKKNNAFVCVRDKCLKGLSPSECRQCRIVYTTSDTRESFRLDQSAHACAKCLIEKCNDVITENCGAADTLKNCAYLENPTNVAPCKAAVAYDGGTPKEDASSFVKVRACANQCEQECK